MTSFEDLVRAASSGDRVATGRIFSEIQAGLYRFMLRHGSPSEAEDLTQETVVEALRTLPALREPAAFRGWVWRIAVRVVAAAREKKRLRARLDQEAGRRRPQLVEEDAMREAERREARGAVRAAVDGLDEELRTAVVLRYEQGLSYAEIATATDVAEGTVGARLHAALKRLEAVLAGAGVLMALAAMEAELSRTAEAEVPPALRERLAKTIAGRPASSRRGRTLALAGVAAILAVLCGVAIHGASDGSASGKAGGPAVASKASAESDGAGGGETGSPDASGKSTATKPEDAGSMANDASTSSAQETPASLSGHLRRRSDGSPVGDARVWLEKQAGRSDPMELLDVKKEDLAEYIRTHPLPEPTFAAETRTDADGRYAFTVPAGGYDILAQAEGVVGPQVTGGLLAMRRIEHEDAVHAGTAKEEDFHDGEESYYPNSVTLAPGTAETRDFLLDDGARLEGQVVDGRGFPVEGATVDLEQEVPAVSRTDRISMGELLGVNGSVRSDAEGKFRVDGFVARGVVFLRVKHAGFADAVQRVEVTGASAEARIALTAVKTLNGFVVDASGRPVAGAVILVDRPDWRDAIDKSAGLSDKEVLLPTDDACDDLGRFHAAAPNDATRWLAAWAPGHGFAILDLREGEGARKLVLPAAAAVLEGEVLDDAGTPVAGARIAVFSLEQGRAHFVFPDEIHGTPPPIDAGDFVLFPPKGSADSRPPKATAGADGRFRLEGLCLPVLLAVEAEGFGPKRVRVESTVFTRFQLGPAAPK